MLLSSSFHETMADPCSHTGRKKGSEQRRLAIVVRRYGGGGGWWSTGVAADNIDFYVTPFNLAAIVGQTVPHPILGVNKTLG
jgi:hypothetical protein